MSFHDGFYDTWDHNVEVVDETVVRPSFSSMRTCPQCGARMRPYEQYCHRCCSWVGRLCPHCHMPVKGTDRCVYCGTVLRQKISMKQTVLLSSLLVTVIGAICVGYILLVPHAATAGSTINEPITFVYDDPESNVHVDADVFEGATDQYVMRASGDKPMAELKRQMKAAGIDAAVTGSVSQSDTKGIDNYLVAIVDDESLFKPASEVIAKFYRKSNTVRDSFNIIAVVTKDVSIEDVQNKLNKTVTLVVPDEDFPKPEYGHALTSYYMYLDDSDKAEQKLDARLLELFRQAHKQIN